jgi:hypothetical protein
MVTENESTEILRMRQASGRGITLRSGFPNPFGAGAGWYWQALRHWAIRRAGEATVMMQDASRSEVF